MFLAIGSPQTRNRDCYASAPNLDLTLRSNAEELVQIMDSYGQFTQAGFDPPAVAPVLVLGAAGLIPNGWYGYIYVYAAKFRYPLVDAGVSAGGSIAPRSNPSPSGNIQMVGGPKHISITLTTTQRGDISHIWIYRTLVFTTQQEAIDAVNAGTAFYVGEIANNPNVPTIVFDDNLAIAAGEECDMDNFPAPIFQLCQYFAPYFWGFGNNRITIACTISADGTFVLTDTSNAVFAARNGQIISFEGISTGGFDGRGNYYFKWTGSFSGAAMLDIGLTLSGISDFTGDTFVSFAAQSNILYRSKPNNPLAWGQTDFIDDIRVPSLYAFRIGGGEGRAIAIITNLNLLKLDTNFPSICYVLNLRLAGTPGFEESKRELSRGYSVSNHFSQFSTQSDNGNSVLWGYDFESSSILQCDGSSQVPISSKIFESLRSFQPFQFNHGIYDERTELAIFWQRSLTVDDTNDVAILYHVPTGNWFLHKDWDITCSANIVDSVLDRSKTIVGTSTGLIGQDFVENKIDNWVPHTFPRYGKFNLIANPGTDLWTIQADGLAIFFDTTHSQYWIGNTVGICSIAAGPTIDSLEQVPTQIVDIIDNSTITLLFPAGVAPGGVMFAFIGYIPVEFRKSSQLSSPVDAKQLTEMFLTVKNIKDLSTISGWGFKQGIELSLSNTFSAFPTGANHFNFNESESFYNKNLCKSITFSSMIGMRIVLINDTAPIELYDYTIAFQNP